MEWNSVTEGEDTEIKQLGRMKDGWVVLALLRRRADTTNTADTEE